MTPGSADRPLRVAIIGSGPAAFYAADCLYKESGLTAEIDMFDRVPTPFGLVRFGVAPDHPKIKSVTRVFEVIAGRPNFRFYGNVELGRHISVADLRDHYHQIIYATGAQSDRHMGIPGEELRGSYAATEFVAWYNGHPDYRDCQFDLSCECAVVVGVGNVTVDVARILCRTRDELAATDMADYAIEALGGSRIKRVCLLGRRGPAQAAFTNPEIRELGEMTDADVLVPPDEAALDPLSRAVVESSLDRSLKDKVALLQGYGRRVPTGRPRRLDIRFLVSPTELHGDTQGWVSGVRMVHNELYVSDDGSLRPRATDRFEDLEAGLVFRSVGYRGVALPGVPFDERRGIVPNAQGRVIDPATSHPVVGEYVTGWIKRGPSGIIGTNKPDSVETVKCMLTDLANGTCLEPGNPGVASMAALVGERQPHHLTYGDWLRIDEIEQARGQPLGRPRVKLTSVADMLAALGRQ
jgi:ferredoxin/flavodoxin---NADP+ reductase